MKKKLLIFLIPIVILACNKTTKNDNNITDIQTLKSETKIKNWYDDLIVDYINKSDNQLIKSALKNKEQVDWILDRTEKTDSTNYYIFKIGQDVTDENNTNPRFSFDGWIYIDSLSKKIYEYDLPNDSLIIWKNKYNR